MSKITRIGKFQLFLFFLGLLTFQGCTLEGACEYYYTYSSTNYYCSDVSEPNLFGVSSASDVCFYGDGNTFHEGSSCNAIGYTMPSSVGDYQYNANGDPSPYGAYAYASNGTSSGGTGGGSSATTCDPNTVWTGAPNDIQVSTQCQTACVYANAGSQQGKDAACAIIAQWGATSSCSVCP